VFIDFASGIFFCAVISIAGRVEFSWLNYAVALFFAFCPDDLDVPVYLALRKKLKLASHRFFHHPLIVLPLVFAVGYWWQGYFGALLCFVPTAAHFFHDSFNPTGKKSGIRWLSPFNWDLFCIEGWAIHKIPWEEWQSDMKKAAKGVEKRSIEEEITSRLEPIGKYTAAYLAVSILLLIFHFLLSGSW
jgi:hypothetical protein